MTKTQFNSIYKLIFGMSFLLMSGVNSILNTVNKTDLNWPANVCLFVGLMYIFLAGVDSITQKYDETGKPL